MPEQQVRVAPRAVDVVYQRVEPQHLAGESRVYAEGGGVEVECARQEVDAQVQPGAGPQQSLHLLVGLAGRERRVHLNRHEIGYRQAQFPGQPRTDDLGDECLATLSCAAELDHVCPEVVGFHEPGERTALAQGRHVPGCKDGTQHGCTS